MSGSLLAFILTRLDQVEAPVFSHGELHQYPAAEVEPLLSEGIVQEGSTAAQLFLPRLFAGGTLVVRETAQGFYGVVDDDDYFDPIRLTTEDIRQYSVSLPRLAAALRRENDIHGTGWSNDGGLISLGQRPYPSLGTIDVYLSLPNGDEAAFLLRCHRLQGRDGCQRVVLLTPRGVPMSPEARQVLDSRRVVVASLMGAAKTTSLYMDWNEVLGSAALGLASDYPKDVCIFLKQGKTWLVVYEGQPRSVHDSLGMTYISLLLRGPSREIHAATLRSAAAGEDGPLRLGSAGPVLDEHAFAAYKSRLQDIEAERAEAEANHDLGLQEQLQAESDALTAELAQATGLHGRHRQAAADRDRARDAVTKTIRRALRALKHEHEPVWSHFDKSLILKEFLSYNPDRPLTWVT